MPKKSVSANKTALDELASQINNNHKICQSSPASALLYGYSIGSLLWQAKALLPTTKWQEWLKTNCSFSITTAETYLKIASGGQSLPTVAIAKANTGENREEKLEKIEKTAGSELVVVESKLISAEAEEEEGKIIAIAPQAPGSLAESKSPKSSSQTKIIDTEVIAVEAEEISGENVSDCQPKNPPISENKTTPKKPENIVLYIPGNVVPKARPRVTAKGTYLPPRYRQWRNMAEVEIYRQISETNMPVDLPIKKATISIRFCGQHRTNSDLDNMAGACLDALTLNGAGVLKDDRISCIPKLTVEYIANSKETGIWIEIEPLN